MPITTTRLHRDITRTLQRLLITRRFCMPEENMRQHLDELLDHIAFRPLSVIDPELDARLRVHRCGRRTP